MINFGVSATFLFKQWLNHDKNKDFKLLFMSTSKDEREKLVNHLSAPFLLINKVATNRETAGGWNFDSPKVNLSVYSYQSVLGEGWLSALVIFGIQLLIPAMLLYSALIRSPRIDPGGANSLEKFCTKEGSEDGLIVNFCIILFYAIRQVPQVMYTFFETAGEASTTRSKLNSLRTYVWEQGRDNFGMQVGYKLEKYMNSVYIALVNSLMLFVLFLQLDPAEIVLNAIAIEFVLEFAKEVPRSALYDPSNRYIRAGCCELVLKSVINTRALGDAKQLCAAFDIDLNAYKEAVSKDGHDWRIAFHSAKLSDEDEENLEYSDAKKSVWKAAEQYAVATKNRMALWVFKEYPIHFGLISTWLGEIGLGPTCIFRRYQDYHTWSRWEKVMFLCPCTEVRSTGQDSFEVVTRHMPAQLASVQEELKDTQGTRYLNDTMESDLSVFERFLLDIFKTLTFQYYALSLYNAWTQRSLRGFVFRALDGIVEFVAYVYQIIFPFTLIGFLVLLFACY